MADSLTIDADASSLIAALDRLGPTAERHVMGAARVTGGKVANETRGRVRRATGLFASSVTIAEDATSVNVFYGPMSGRSAQFPIWQDFGTKFMPANPALFAAARLEEGDHTRRVEDAVTDAIDDVGLG